MSDPVNPNMQRYTDEDLAKWAGSEGGSTVRVMNDIRKDAGYDHFVEFGTDDKTASVTKEEQEALSASNLAMHGAPGVVHIIAAGVEESAVGVSALGAGMVLELIATGKEIIAGDKIGAAVERDMMHAAMLANLDMPQGYKDGEMTKLMSKYTEGDRAAAQVVAEKGRGADKTKMVIVQLHADQGANAARAMCDAHLTKAEYAQQHLEVARRYVTDPAFKRGFDSIVWAKETSPSEYAKATTALDARDARYTQAHVRYSV